MPPCQNKNIHGSQSENENTNDNKGGRIVWSKDLVYILCNLCVKHVEKSKGKNGGVTSQRLNWKKIELEFQKETKLSWDKLKLKHKIDHLRGIWGAWKDLKRKATGLGWDHIKGTVDASVGWWALRIQENPKFKEFQDEGIEPDLEVKLEQIFSCSAQGNNKYTPGSQIQEDENLESRDSAGIQRNLGGEGDDSYMPTPPRGDICVDDIFGENENNDARVDGMNDSWNELWSDPVHDTPIRQDETRKGKRAFEGESSQRSKSARTSNPKKGKNKHVEEMLSDMMETIAKRNESNNEVTILIKDMIKSYSSAHLSKFDIGEAMAKLCCLPDLSPTSNEFLYACSLLEDPQRRTVFFSLPDDTSRVAYIKFMYKESRMNRN